jgi:hypothetical protein
MVTQQIQVKGGTLRLQSRSRVLWLPVEAGIGRPDMKDFGRAVAGATTYADLEKVVQAAVSKIGLMEFMRLDSGAVIAKAKADANSKSIRLIIGNPLDHAINGAARS